MPYLHRVDKSPLEFTLTLSLLDGLWTPEKRMEVVKFLIYDNYKPFQTLDDLSKIYYCMVVDSGSLMTGGLKQGYITIKMRCNSPYCWSVPYISQYDLSENETSTIITLENLSNVNDLIFPEVQVALVDNSTGFKIRNNSDGGQITEFTNLTPLETVYLHNHKKQIMSNLNLNRYPNFNGKWLKLLYGENQLEIFEKCKIQFKVQYPIIK